MSVVVELENALQAMLVTKPPGVSGSKINQITEISAKNVQSESVIIGKLYTHFKKCPGTHKLGPLYVVDSVARKYLDLAKKSQQPVSAEAPDGTYGAGVYRITQLLPSLMNDILQHAPPEENKDKIEKLVAIWERSSTFPPEVLMEIKQRIASSPMSQAYSQNSTTPTGSPPPHLQSLNGQMQAFPQYPMSQPQQPQNQAQPNASNTASILQALANMAKQNQTVTSPAAPAQAPTPPVAATPQYNVSNGQMNGMSGLSQDTSLASRPIAPQVQAPVPISYTPTPPIANNVPMYGNQMPGMYLGQQQQPQQQQPQQPQQPQIQASYSQYTQQQPQQPQQVPGAATAPVDQMALLQLLLNYPGLQGMSLPQLTQSFGALGTGAIGGADGQNGQALPMWQQQQMQQLQQMINPQVPQNASEPPRDGGYNRDVRRNERGYSPPPMSPPRYQGRRGRSRSRSPARFDRGGRASPRGRRERSRTPPNGNRFNGKGSQGGDRTTPTLPKFNKLVEFDEGIASNSIKVLSRTLFVGGVTISEDELRGLFERHGLVQSCIVNQDKRHAFIKMLTRDDAVKARAGMETYRADNMTIRTRWGVGYGPRDCSDYQTGISIIPIDRLTDADQRWMVSAEYGGTGGKPLVGGMVVEEPDIEIGQGVSSKAISKRFPTDSGGAKGPRSSHDTFVEAHREQRNRRTDYNDNNQRGGRDNNIGVAPPTPGFGAGLPFMNFVPPNMPNGFQYPGFPPGQSSGR
ncbi:hypothetical protein DFP73DRAFT_574143 [Morchella snyderi]|nr:hypothetical protein DFP73DRAFT_574143 [Morchella snyderi]